MNPLAPMVMRSDNDFVSEEEESFQSSICEDQDLGCLFSSSWVA